MEMYLGKVTREYAEQEQERMKREARQQSRLKSAFYITTETIHSNDEIIDEPDIHIESEDECEESLIKSTEATSVNYIITRKNQNRFSKSEQMVHSATQTEVTEFAPINIPLRIKSSAGSGVFAKIKPSRSNGFNDVRKFQCNRST